MMRDEYLRLGGEAKEFKKFEGKVEQGYRFEYSKQVSEVDVELFGLISGDLNPIHFNEEVAAKTKFGGRVVHGMLTTSFISAAVARLPGTIVLLETCFRYKAPVRIGDEVRVVGEIVEVDENGRCRINVECLVGEKVVVEGWVKILVWQ